MRFAELDVRFREQPALKWPRYTPVRIFAPRMDRQSLSALRRVADVPLAVACAFAVAALVILGLVQEARVMPVSLARILAVQQHLASGAGPTGGVAVLGSSVVLEGIDCAEVARRLPADTPCENLSWTGGTARQWLLVEPALRQSPPRVVVLGLDLLTLLHRDSIPPDRLAMAGWWGFVPASERDSLRPVLGDEGIRVLDAPRAVQLLRLRSFPLNALNEGARERARRDLRYDGYTTNFTAPWIRRSPAPPAAIEMHLEQMQGMVRAGATLGATQIESVLALLLEKARAARPTIRFLLVLTPIHPRLGEQLGGAALDEIRRSVATLAARLDAGFSDDLLALPTDGFSDAVHPFGAGRDAWSARLGDEVAPLLAN